MKKLNSVTIYFKKHNSTWLFMSNSIIFINFEGNSVALFVVLSDQGDILYNCVSFTSSIISVYKRSPQWQLPSGLWQCILKKLL